LTVSAAERKAAFITCGFLIVLVSAVPMHVAEVELQRLSQPLPSWTAVVLVLGPLAYAGSLAALKRFHWLLRLAVGVATGVTPSVLCATVCLHIPVEVPLAREPTDIESMMLPATVGYIYILHVDRSKYFVRVAPGPNEEKVRHFLQEHNLLLTEKEE
jgi:hypothetical protein